MTMKSETEILGAIDSLLAELPDDAARERAFAWLRAKHAPNPAVKAAPAPTVNPPAFIPFPYVPPPPVIERDPRWPGTLEITCKEGLTTDAPQHRPPEFYQAQGCAQLQVTDGVLSWNASPQIARNPGYNPDYTVVTMGGPNAYPSHVHVGSSAH